MILLALAAICASIMVTTGLVTWAAIAYGWSIMFVGGPLVLIAVVWSGYLFVTGEN